MKFLGFNKVLCFAPHPDDIEISMGGTILKNKDTIFDIIIFETESIGEKITTFERFKECANFWADTENARLHFEHDLLSSDKEDYWIWRLGFSYPFSNYDCIFIPPSLDTHYEHRLVHNIAMAMTRSTPISVIEYRSASTLEDWRPNLFSDIASTDTEKFNRLKAFKSQNPIFFSEEFLRGMHSHLNSTRKGRPVTEQFKINLMYENANI
jgi:hypothetical protein